MQKGTYAISKHAKLRQGERCFTIGDIKNIIYTDEYADCNYAIRGKTLDDERARICIAFIEKSHFIVITVIRLEI